jgi:alanine-glyoxylate transaminase / serine-glyoxylate transaminase / serine-pyruvate transaminase
MRAYEAGTAMYFATPPVQLVYALHASLRTLTAGTPGLQARFAAHKAAAQRVRAAAAALGMRTLAREEGFAANGMTALWFPEGIVAADVLPKLAARDVVVAAGLHKEVKGDVFFFLSLGVVSRSVCG